MSISNESDASSATYKITLKGDGVTIAKDIDAAIAAEVMALVVGGPSYGSATSTKPKATKPRSHRGSAKKSSESAAKTRAKKRSGSPGIVNDLELRPKGKQSFVDFAMEKKPDGHFEKQAVSLYWLRHIAGVATGISVWITSILVTSPQSGPGRRRSRATCGWGQPARNGSIPPIGPTLSSQPWARTWSNTSYRERRTRSKSLRAPSVVCLIVLLL
jgi:hypothetical protein